MTPARMDRFDFLSAIVLIVFASGVLIESLRMDRLGQLDINSYTVPGLVPGLLGGLLLACGIALLIRSTARGGWRLGMEPGTAAAFFADGATRRVGLTLVLTFGFALGLFGRLPFGLAAAIFIFAFIWLLGERTFSNRSDKLKHIAYTATIALVSGYAIALVFTQIFFVKLP